MEFSQQNRKITTGRLYPILEFILFFWNRFIMLCAHIYGQILSGSILTVLFNFIKSTFNFSYDKKKNYTVSFINLCDSTFLLLWFEKYRKGKFQISCESRVRFCFYPSKLAALHWFFHKRRYLWENRNWPEQRSMWICVFRKALFGA